MRSHSGKCFANSQQLSAEGRAGLPALQRLQHPPAAPGSSKSQQDAASLRKPPGSRRAAAKNPAPAPGFVLKAPLWSAGAAQTSESRSMGVSTGSLHRSWDSQEPGDEAVKGGQVLGEWPLQKALGRGPAHPLAPTTTAQSAQGQLSPWQVSCSHGSGLTEPFLWGPCEPGPPPPGPTNGVTLNYREHALTVLGPGPQILVWRGRAPSLGSRGGSLLPLLGPGAPGIPARAATSLRACPGYTRLPPCACREDTPVTGCLPASRFLYDLT